MVCEKNKDTVHDFLKDPIVLVRKGDMMMADGTTLGADNGIAVATSLAIMEDKSLEHGPLEFLFTVDEETGLTGANNLGPRLPDRQDPAEPRLRGGGRALRRLLGRAEHDGALGPDDRCGAGGVDGAGCSRSRGLQGRPLGPRDRQEPRQRDQDPGARAVRALGAGRAAWPRSRAATSATPSRARPRRWCSCRRRSGRSRLELVAKCQATIRAELGRRGPRPEPDADRGQGRAATRRVQEGRAEEGAADAGRRCRTA